MKLITELSELKDFPVSFTLGSYDGLHAGHSVLMKELRQVSKNSNTSSLVISFYPHPRKVVDSGYDMRLLNTREEKIEIISSLGIDYIHFINFTKEFSGISYHDFYKNYIFKNLSVKNIIAGANHMFGESRKGNNHLLAKLCSEYSVNLVSVPPVYYGENSISSTRIRQCITEGSVDDASLLLGYDYFIRGIVIRGKGVGSALGFPTANIDILKSEKVIPKKGVYFTSVKYGLNTYYAVSNIGENPTLGGTGLRLETNIFDLEKEIYGEEIEVRFIKRLRDEIRFSSREDLVSAIMKDISEGKKLLKTIRSAK